MSTIIDTAYVRALRLLLALATSGTSNNAQSINAGKFCDVIREIETHDPVTGDNDVSNVIEHLVHLTLNAMAAPAVDPFPGDGNDSERNILLAHIDPPILRGIVARLEADLLAELDGDNARARIPPEGATCLSCGGGFAEDDEPIRVDDGWLHLRRRLRDRPMRASASSAGPVGITPRLRRRRSCVTGCETHRLVRVPYDRTGVWFGDRPMHLNKDAKCD